MNSVVKKINPIRYPGYYIRAAGIITSERMFHFVVIQKNVQVAAERIIFGCG